MDINFFQPYLNNFTRTVTAQAQKDWCEESQLAKRSTTDAHYLRKGSKTFLTPLRKKNKLSVAEEFAANATLTCYIMFLVRQLARNVIMVNIY